MKKIFYVLYCMVLFSCSNKTNMDYHYNGNENCHEYKMDFFNGMGINNMQNRNGDRHGAWLDTIAEKYIEVGIYKNGKKDGLFRWMSCENGVLSLYSSSVYKNGEEVGPAYYFYPNGSCMYSVDSISMAKKFISLAYEDMRNSAREGYYTFYDELGRIQKEGWCIFYDNMDDDLVQEVGNWIVYDTSGCCKYKKLQN